MSAQLTVASLLSAWEDSWSKALSERATIMLSAADPEMPAESISGLTIGARDQKLFAMRVGVFGSDLVAVATCPACSTQIELHFDAREVPDSREPPATDGLEVTWDGCVVRFRSPQVRDLTAIHAASSASAARSMLLERCIESAARNGEPIGCGDLPPAAVDGIVEAMAAADPAAEIELDLTCSACSNRWAAPLDIAAFLWEEMNAWAARLLRDVHTLASAYGWNESDILSLSPHRRQMYLELCHG